MVRPNNSVGQCKAVVSRSGGPHPHGVPSWPWPLNEMPIGRWTPDYSPVPEFLRRFDWLLYKGVVNMTHPHPRSVFLHPSADMALALRKRLERLQLDVGSIAALAVGGADDALSAVLSSTPDVGALLADRTFQHVYYEGLDVPYGRVRPLPEGLADNYVCDHAGSIRRGYLSAAMPKKQFDLLAAWGAYWPGNDRIPSRRRALAWLSTMRNNSGWLHHRMIPRDAYWERLPEYRFILNPIGACVQNVRLWEALHLGVIPIGDAASFADTALLAEGYPIVLVSDWSEITQSRLRDWWKRLAPRVQAVRPHLTVGALHAMLESGRPVGELLGDAPRLEAQLRHAATSAWTRHTCGNSASLSMTDAGRASPSPSASSAPADGQSTPSASSAPGGGRWVRDQRSCTPSAGLSAQWRTCSPTGFRWTGTADEAFGRQPPTVSRQCAMLRAAGVRRVLFIGDSFARHAYVGALLTLSGRYDDGALTETGRRTPECTGVGQFTEKACRKLLTRSAHVCHGAIELSFAGEDLMPNYHYTFCVRQRSYACLQQSRTESSANNVPVPTDAHWRDYDRVVWGTGRHQVPSKNPDKFRGLEKNDVAGLEAHVLQSMCRATKAPDPRAVTHAPPTNATVALARRRLVSKRLVWLDTLHRTAPPFSPDECPSRLQDFHLEMPRALKRVCDATRVASVWEATVALAATPGSSWEEMTHDGVHWGMAVNLLLAREVVRQLIT